MSLAEVVSGHRIVVSAGSGGVGKTTVAASLSLWGALSGRRTVVLTIDPALPDRLAGLRQAAAPHAAGYTLLSWRWPTPLCGA